MRGSPDGAPGGPARLVPGALYSAHSSAAVADLLELWRERICLYNPQAGLLITELQVIIDRAVKRGLCD